MTARLSGRYGRKFGDAGVGDARVGPGSTVFAVDFVDALLL